MATATTQIIELNQNNADRVDDNGNYICHLSKQIMMKEGDQLTMRLASIDSQKSDSQSIVLADDTPISIAFSYYDVDYISSDKYVFDKTATWTRAYGTHAMYDEKRILLLDSVTFNVPAYDPGVVQCNCRVFFSWVAPDGTHHTNQLPSQDYFTYAYTGNCQGAYGDDNVTCTPQIDRITFIEGTLSIIGSIAHKGYPFPNPLNPTPAHYVENSEVTSVYSVGQRNLQINTVGAVIPAGRYDRNTMALEITKKLTEVGIDPEILTTDQFLIPNTDLVLRTDNPKYAAACWMEVRETKTNTITFDNSNSYVYWTGTELPKIQCGARKFAVEYGRNGETFQLSSAHQSVYNTAGTENVGFFTTGTAGVDLRYHQVAAATGIVIHGMQPVEFWQDTMGLYDKLVVPLQTDTNGVHYYLKDDLIGKLPSESASITIFSSSNDRTIADPPTIPMYIDTTSVPTNAVVGESPIVNNDGGYYLVEIDGLGSQSNFIDNEQVRANISAVVSTQYDSNDIVTGFADSSIPYVHKGNPVAIGSLRVRILDPAKQVSPTLGPNNAVFLQLDSVEEKHVDNKGKDPLVFA